MAPPATTAPQSVTYSARIIRGVSFFSLIPMLAPIAGLIGGAYVAYNNSAKYDNSRLTRIGKTLLGGVAGAVAGTVGMFLPPGLSAVPVGLAMSSAKATIDWAHDRKKTGRIGFESAFARIGGVLLGAIPLLGPTLSDRMLERTTANFKNPPPPPSPAKPADRTKVIRAVSFFSCVPFLAPFAGLAGGAYTAYKKSEEYGDTTAQRVAKTLMGGVAGVAAGTVGMFLPPMISAMPVGAVMGGVEATIDVINDQKMGAIGVKSTLARVGGALVGAIPIVGPTLSNKALEKTSKSFKNAHQAQSPPPPPAPPSSTQSSTSPVHHHQPAPVVPSPSPSPHIPPSGAKLGR